MKILIVEDDEFTAQALKIVLDAQNYVVEVTGDGETAWELIKVFRYDLILLDIKLPKLDGISLCRRMRSHNFNMPILLMTGQDSTKDKVTGLDAGADDYLVKPCDQQELVARVRALLRRGELTIPPILAWENLRLDPSSCEVTYNQQPIHLTPKEYGILELFLRNSRRIFSCQLILDHLWAFDKVPQEDAVRTQIKGLRQKLKAAGATDLIETVYGIGYRLKPLENTFVASKEVGEQTRQQTLSAIGGVWHQFKDKISDRIAIIEQATTDLLQETLTSELRAAAEQQAHILAGSLGTFGFGEASRLARKIERIFHGSSDIALDKAISLSKLVTTLRQEIQHNPTGGLVDIQHQDNRPLLLIVDSDRTLANELVSVAQQQGIRTIVATSLAAAKDVIYRENLQVVLLDLAICPTSADTWQFLAIVSAVKPPVPILVYTAQNSWRDRLEVARLGVRCFLQKPLQPDLVLEKVTQALQQVDTTTKIMIVDDDPQILATSQSLLTPWGLKVTTLANPLLFWQTLAAFTPDLLILDMKMPDVSGIELCQAVRNDVRWDELPILLLTPDKDADSVNQVFGVGADDFISKPIVGPEFVTRIINCLERIKLLRSLAQIDPLTGVANRQQATLEIEKLLATKDCQFLCFAIIHVERLPQLNHCYSYATGDAILRQIAQLLQSVCSNKDVVSRWAGAEFVVGMYGMTKIEALERLAQVRSTLAREDYLVKRISDRISLRVGLAQYPDDGTDVRSLYLSAATLNQPKTYDFSL